MATLEGKMAAAARDGRAAARAGKLRNPPTPGLDSDDPRDRVIAKMWCRGWDDGNPMAAIPDDSTDDTDTE